MEGEQKREDSMKEECHEHAASHEHSIVHKKRGFWVWKISTIILVVLLVAAVFTGGFTKIFSGTLTGEQVAEKCTSYINQYLLQGQGKATSKGVEELDGLYKVKLNVNGRDIDSYATKDGALLFPSVINLNEAPEQAEAPKPKDIPKTDKPEVLLFTMSYCPYGNQAEEGIYPVVGLLEGVEIQPHYVIYSNYRGGGKDYCLDAENKYCSMHGIQELNEDVRELCIYKYQKEKFWDFLMRVNDACDSRNVDVCWENVAKESGVDVAKIKKCQQDEAVELLKNELALNGKYSVQGSPTLIINGADYNSGRTPEAYKSAICSAFNTAPSECGKALESDQAAAPTGGCG